MNISVDPAAMVRSYADRVQRVTSPGGVSAWLFDDHTLPILSVGFGFRGGAARDPAGKAGTARMLADLLTEGAGNLDGSAFRRALGDSAVQLSFSAQQAESLGGSLRALARNAGQAFHLLGLSLRDPLLAQTDLARIREAACAQVRRSLAQTDHVAMTALFAHGFPDHPYGRPTDGDLTSLPAITRTDIVALQEALLTRGNLEIAVVGAIGADALGPLLDSAFAELPGGATPPVSPCALAHVGERFVTSMASPQTALYFGRPGLHRDDPDAMAAVVVNHCLGGGTFSSRLFQELREARGLCYSVWSSLRFNEGGSTLLGATATPNERAGEALEVIQGEVARLVQEGIGTDELEAAKSYLTGSYGLNFDTSRAIASLLLTLKLDRRDPSWLDERNRRIAAVTEADAARAIERLFGDGALLVTAAGEPDDRPIRAVPKADNHPGHGHGTEGDDHEVDHRGKPGYDDGAVGRGPGAARSGRARAGPAGGARGLRSRGVPPGSQCPRGEPGRRAGGYPGRQGEAILRP
ncbi:M16 family metallopeptidase [Methylobacterium sp. Leaf118]|uniref:M16 family metallopeptidase n=1 Tax=Methylobacterium sp. Leaf118 TaxID=2876562 RepID=UPI001E40042F|nr:pitrilysin family protein [Methylobacterium sp. Leaf118]